MVICLFISQCVFILTRYFQTGSGGIGGNVHMRTSLCFYIKTIKTQWVQR